MSAFVITADSAGYGRRDRFSLWMDKVHLSLHREFLRLATFSSLSFTPQSLSSSSSMSSIPAGVRREASHAEELAGTGITATVVHPGLTRTENVDAMIARLAK